MQLLLSPDILSVEYFALNDLSGGFWYILQQVIGTMSTNLVLLVEDDPTLRFMGRRQLKQLNLDCDTAENGLRAVELATSGTCYAAIFLDLGLPVMDGVNAAIRIREHESRNNLPRVPIIALTAFPAQDRCKLAGMDDFVLKPVMLDTLKALLTKWNVLIETPPAAQG